MYESLWMGTEASFYEATAAYDKLMTFVADKGITLGHTGPEARVADSGDQTQPADPYNDSEYLDVQDGVGIISIEGAMRDRTFGWLGKMFGLTGYGDIAQALMTAVKHPDVNSIMLVIKSPGGQVDGCQELANFIAEVDKVKPVYSYAASVMSSAALWLGVAARKVYSSETSIIGSLGVLTVVMSRARQLQADGVDAKVVRSGKYKALGHPVDPLSEEAIANAQAQADYLANIFLKYVASRRGDNMQAAERKYGQGQEFIGAQAVDVGLVDGIANYTEAFLSTKASAIQRDNKPLVFGAQVVTGAEASHNARQEETNMPKHLPTPEQLATMAGITAEVATTALAAAAGATAEVTAPVTEAATAPVAEVDSEIVVKLTADMSAVQAALAESTAALAEANAKLEAADVAAKAIESQRDTLAGIVRTGMRGMKVALGGKADEVDAISVDTLASAHAEVLETFKSKFKAGGVAATRPAVEEASQSAPVAVNPLFVAAMSKSRK